jgi:uncharacterized protein (DUF2236 family)
MSSMQAEAGSRLVAPWSERYNPAGPSARRGARPGRRMATDPAASPLSNNFFDTDPAQQAHDWARLEERLAYAAAQAAGEVEGVFGPASLSWRLLREAAGLAAGPATLLLQLAHPAIAAGVDQHSNLRRNPLERARRTFYLMYQLIFGDLPTALGAARRLHHMHQVIAGKVDPGCSTPWAGRLYRASQPELLLWVWATLVRMTVVAHEALVGSLTAEERVRHYAEAKLAAALFGIPAEDVPLDLAAFDRYYAGMLAGPELHVVASAREVASYMFNLSLTRFTRWDELVTAGFLPPALRAAYGLPWPASAVQRFNRYGAFVRRIVPLMPPAARYVPAYHQAMLRVARARGERGSLTARLINQLDRRIDLPLSIRPVPDRPSGSANKDDV